VEKPGISVGLKLAPITARWTGSKRETPMLGVKTIGNATLIAFDGGPVLATDPWFGDEDDACFGSWSLTHQIPAVEKSEIQAAKYIWFSHGHPDHLNPNSITRLRDSLILLPNHVGNRIRNDLKSEGYNVTVLPDGQWVVLSKRVKVFCISDYIQDAVLLVDVGGRLFINMNDANAFARVRVISKIVREYQHSYLLRLSGYGGASLLNFFDPEGRRVEPKLDLRVGRFLSQYAQRIGAKNVIPFSSFHQYRREDSAWANASMPPLSAYRDGFDERIGEFIPPFVWVDCASGATIPLNPAELSCSLLKPDECGDSWSDQLDADDKKVLDDYFYRKEALRDALRFISFRVGGKEHTIDLSGPRDRGITFEAPRNSLMTAATHRVFDDLLLGAFMKIILHNADFDRDFVFYTGKYADNGCSETKEALRSYFSEYRKRSGVDWIIHHLVNDGHTLFRRYVRADSKFYSLARDAYVKVLRH
jgi:hypothetical protein